jgi:hypothetical protein
MTIYLVGLIVIGILIIFIGIPALIRYCFEDCSKDNNKYTEI